jgi:copper(I)-binding protein
MSAAALADLVVEEGHVRALPPGVTNTSAYMTLRNTGSQPRVLVSASSSAAARVTLHSTMNHNGMLHMQQMENLTIPAGGSVSLEPGTTHLMLEDLTSELEPGSQVELVLVFADGEQETIALPVKSVLDE